MMYVAHHVNERVIIQQILLVKGQKESVDYHAFVDAVIPGHTSLRNGSGRQRLPKSVVKLQKIKHDVALYNSAFLILLKNRKDHLSASLQQIDVNATGQLDFECFRKAMKMAGIILSDADTQRVFDRFDVASSGFIRYDDVLQMLGCKT